MLSTYAFRSASTSFTPPRVFGVAAISASKRLGELLSWPAAILGSCTSSPNEELQVTSALLVPAAKCDGAKRNDHTVKSMRSFGTWWVVHGSSHVLASQEPIINHNLAAASTAKLTSGSREQNESQTFAGPGRNARRGSAASSSGEGATLTGRSGPND